jgi:hypothetical protein
LHYKNAPETKIGAKIGEGVSITMKCRVCDKQIAFIQEDFKDAHGERYHEECFRKQMGFIKWEWNTKKD